eukprot:TRINITY_DN11280_c0_g1_i1.p1 TRINITY_DN11280_c0_g1~~TRINITY_DN11280_c0_g1_i1.p1  ORF type:complete len:469 (-),score=90.76 TRINITY_DN11280_c0_g1_i1:194-1600(-)
MPAPPKRPDGITTKPPLIATQSSSYPSSSSSSSSSGLYLAPSAAQAQDSPRRRTLQEISQNVGGISNSELKASKGDGVSRKEFFFDSWGTTSMGQTKATLNALSSIVEGATSSRPGRGLLREEHRPPNPPSSRAAEAEAAGGVSRMLDEDKKGDFFKLRQIQVEGLLEDGTLGLLLHGTSVVGFCAEGASENGWAVGDQIVEINGNRVSVFDEFLEKFLSAQVQGFPITFSVLRRENGGEEALETGEDDPLDSFFSNTNFVDLAGQLKHKFRASPAPPEMMSGPDMAAGPQRREEAITENPYIQALRRRRSELSRSTEGWTDASGTISDGTDSLAARLATERYDALATLSRLSGVTPRASSSTSKPSGNVCGGSHMKFEVPSFLQALGFPSFCMAANRPCGDGEVGSMEILPTPRVEKDVEHDQTSWAGFDSPAKVPLPAAAILSARGSPRATSARGMLLRSSPRPRP